MAAAMNSASDSTTSVWIWEGPATIAPATPTMPPASVPSARSMATDRLAPSVACTTSTAVSTAQ